MRDKSLYYLSYSENKYSEQNGSMYLLTPSHYKPCAYRNKERFEEKLKELQSNPNVFNIEIDPDKMTFGNILVTYEYP